MSKLIEKTNKNTSSSKLSNMSQKWVDFLIPFTSNYLASFSEAKLSIISSIPRQTLSRLIVKLLKFGVVDFKQEGRNKMFFIPKNNNSKIIINILENYKALNFNMIHSLIIEEIIENSETVIVFGSYASATEKKDSDIDLLILGKTNKKQIEKIKGRSNLEINEHYLSYSEFKKMLKKRNHLSLEILKKHIIFGEVSKVVDLFWGYYYD